MSVTQRHLAVLVTTDDYPADTAHQRCYSGSIRMSRTMAARVACSAWDESANHD
jgi:hypothetical protein